jgi:hypothetical protein
LLTDWTLPN